MAKKLKYLDKSKLDYERKHDHDHFFDVDEETRALYEEKYPLTRKALFRHFLSSAFLRMGRGYSDILLPTLLPHFVVICFCYLVLKMDNIVQFIVSPKVFPFFCVLWFLSMVPAAVHYFVKYRFCLDRAYICGLLLGVVWCFILFLMLLHISINDNQTAAGISSSIVVFTPGQTLALVLSLVGSFLLFYLLGPVSLALKKTKEEYAEPAEKA